MAKNNDIPSYEDTVAYEDTKPVDQEVPSYEDTVAEDQGPSMGGAALRQYSKGASLGFADEIGAVSGALGTRSVEGEGGLWGSLSRLFGAASDSRPTDEMGRPIGEITPEVLEEMSKSTDVARAEAKALSEAYQKALPEVRAQQAAETAADKAAYPITSGIAGMAGSTVPFLATGGAGAISRTTQAASKGLPLLTRMAQGARVGLQEGIATAPQAAALGAVQGVGDTEGNEDLAQNALLGAALGAGSNIAGGAVVGGLAPAVKAGIKTIASTKPGQQTLIGAAKALPRYREAIERFRINLQEGGNTSLAPENVKEVTGKVISKLEGAGQALEKHHTEIIKESAKEISDISKQMANAVAKGSEAEKQAIVRTQLDRAQTLLNDLVQVGEEAGEGIGSMMRNAKGETTALKEGFESFAKAVDDNPYLKNSPEAQDLLNQFKAAISTEAKEVKLPASIMKSLGEEERVVLKDAFKTKGQFSPQEIGELERIIKLPVEERMVALEKMFPELETTAIGGKAIKVVKNVADEENFLRGAIEDAKKRSPELVSELEQQLANLQREKLVGTQLDTELTARIPSKLKETATAPQYLQNVAAIDDAINKAGKDSPLGRELSKYRKELVSKGRQQLLGEGKAAADELAEKYGAFKDILRDYKISNKKELSDSIIRTLEGITNEPNSAVQLNKLRSLKETLSKVNPELAYRIESEFMRINQLKEAVPEGQSAKQIAGFMQEKLPQAELSAADQITREEMMAPVSRYMGQETAEGLEQQGRTAATRIAKSKDVIKLADADTMLKDILDKGEMDPVAERYVRDLQAALSELPDKEAANVINDNKLLFDRFKAMAEDANRTGRFSWDQQLTNWIAASSGRILGKLGRVAGKATAPITENVIKPTNKVAIKTVSKIPGMQAAAQEYEARGMTGAADVLVDAATGPGPRRAAAQFTASQIPFLRKHLEEEKVK